MALVLILIKNLVVKLERNEEKELEALKTSKIRAINKIARLQDHYEHVALTRASKLITKKIEKMIDDGILKTNNTNDVLALMYYLQNYETQNLSEKTKSRLVRFFERERKGIERKLPEEFLSMNPREYFMFTLLGAFESILYKLRNNPYVVKCQQVLNT